MAHIKLKDLLSENHRIDEGVLDVFKKIFPFGKKTYQEFTPEQRKILYAYSKSAYRQINHRLRAKYGVTDIMPDADIKYDPKDIDDKIGAISSAFTKENTNQSKMIVYTGVPPNFEKEVAKNIGKTMNFAGFTSTTTYRGMALNFGELYSDNREEIHILKCVCPPHTLLDIKAVTHNPQEEEHVINYGAKFKVIKQRTDTKTYPNTTIYETEVELLGEQVSPD